MAFALIRPRTIWWPTLLGWACLLGVFAAGLLLWCFKAEPFLALTQRAPADVLVVEGWPDDEALRAARDEFVRGGYRFVVATGARMGERWTGLRWSMAEETERVLLKLGLSREQVILAKPEDVERHRTFASAVAVWRTLQARGIAPKAINVFSLSVHARRSRLVYAKVQRPAVPVGVISWSPAGYGTEPWWESSSRTLELLKETVGYPYELLLNSGRTSNSPQPPGN